MPLEDSELDQILELMLEPNSDDETPEGPVRNYRTLVLHDSTFQYRIDRARKALNLWRDKHTLRERIAETNLIPYSVDVNPHVAKRQAELKGQLNALEGKDEPRTTD